MPERMRPFMIGIGGLLVVVGAVVALLYREADFGWISGLWLGLALVVLGIFDVRSALRRTD
jgi:hypothetical protein